MTDILTYTVLPGARITPQGFQDPSLICFFSPAQTSDLGFLTCLQEGLVHDGIGWALPFVGGLSITWDSCIILAIPNS